jgi:lysophospholipase L1-like esterase
VIPWVRVVRAWHLHLFDGIHYDRRGYRARAQAVVDALDARIRG